MKRCYEWHNDEQGCPQEIELRAADNWRFCPLCGRSTAHVESSSAVFDLPHNQSAEKQWFVTNTGASSVWVDIALEANEDTFLRLGDDAPHGFELRPQATRTIGLKFPPLSRSRQLGHLRLQAHEVQARSDNHAWEMPIREWESVTVRAEVRSPAQAQVEPQLLIFREAISRRCISVHNTGGEPLYLSHLQLPEGYETETDVLTVPGGQRAQIYIQRRGKTGATPGHIDLAWSNGQTHRVGVTNLESASRGVLPQAVIGIDFGTAFTSIVFRRCLRSKLRNDTVSFLSPSEGEEKRFPTRLWLPRGNGDLRFGRDATRQYQRDPTAGYLFRELKTFLREETPAEAIFPAHRRTEAVSAAQRRFGPEWRTSLVIAFLDWIMRTCVEPELDKQFGTAQVTVRYVFSLPVLDSASTGLLYNAQKSQMEVCVESAGFAPESTEWEFEPACAALGLIHPLDENWPSLGNANYPVAEGKPVVVFDSGGGTTDVILTRARYDETGRITLQIEKCLGVGRASETFGGEAVTTSLLEALNQPQTIKGLWSGAINLNRVLGTKSDAENQGFSVEQRDQAESLKIALGKRGVVEEQRGEGQLQSGIIDHLVEAPLDSLREELQKHGFAPTSLREAYFLCVGGNSALDAFERWVEAFMGGLTHRAAARHLRLPEEHRQLAVAYGTAWVPDAHIKNAAPYQLQLHINGENVLNLAKNATQEVPARLREIEVDAGENLVFEALAEIEADSLYRVASVTLTNQRDKIALCEAEIALQGGKLVINVIWRDLDTDERGTSLRALEYLI